eukprot:1196275-Prorocentrum_minimum.AAC.5
MYRTTHLKDASGILHFKSGSEAYGRLDLAVNSPLCTLQAPSTHPPRTLQAPSKLPPSPLQAANSPF